MKLSTKLKISFCILILVPVFLFAMTFIAIMTFQIKSIDSRYDTSGTSYNTLTNPVVLVSNICESEYKKLESASTDQPSLFSDTNFLNGINTELSKRCAYLIIEQDNRCTYSGNKESESMLRELHTVDYNDDTSAAGIYFGGDYQVIVKRVGFVSSKGANGNAYIVMKIQELIPQMKMLLVDGIIAVILILILTSALFVTWIYKETVSPINKLKLATYNIKNGNLDFDMNVSGKDEISELCRDFDAMRLKLKENAEDKLNDDSESKILISNISHDLKTPITAIKGYVEGIMDGVADTDEKMDRYIKTIYNKACDMDKLIDELTFYSKIDTNRMPYNFSKIYVSRYFDDCVDEIGMDLEEKGIKLVYNNNIDSDTRVIADAEQLKRVINNIINNSVKYMQSDDEQITISISEGEDKVYIKISDNGKGIPDKDLPYIFDRFYRADASRNSGMGGSGIGLSIVKKIIQDHNASITAESEEGKGTSMNIEINKYSDKKLDQEEK